MDLKRVVITGLGALTPIGNTTREYWDGLVNGISGAGPITRFNASLFKTQFACEIKNYDPLNYFDRKKLRKLDTYAQYAIIVSEEAVKDASLESEKIDKSRIGVIFGSGIGGLKTFQEEVEKFTKGDGYPRFSPFFIPKMISDIAAGHISIKHGFRGPNFATVSACATSTNAIIDAFNYVRLGMADAIVSGGSEASVVESGIGGFNAMHALSTRNDDPKTASRPMDKNRDGFVFGEGAGCVILENLDHALARGAKIYAEIIGVGLSADAYHITAPHPDGLGAVDVMRNCLQNGNIAHTEVDLINMHGTSTPLGDLAEVRAIKSVFKDHSYSMNINSTKSMTGHLLGAAGVIEIIACILSIEHGIVPPTINHFEDDDQIDSNINFTFNKTQKRDINIAISNTFGFGGHNACVMIKKFRL